MTKLRIGYGCIIPLTIVGAILNASNGVWWLVCIQVISLPVFVLGFLCTYPSFWLEFIDSRVHDGCGRMRAFVRASRWVLTGRRV